jgi:hypothetical protein
MRRRLFVMVLSGGLAIASTAFSAGYVVAAQTHLWLPEIWIR